MPYTNRGDEVGDNARAAQTFKEKLVRIEQLEQAEKEAARRAAEQRRADMHALAEAFESTVASVVRSVSASSTELEAAAEGLGATAGATRDLSSKVLSASTQASENVQSVSFATERLIALLGEISQQVQESSRIALEAVAQAEKTDARITELTRGRRPHRRRGQPHHRHRRADQSIGAQRHHSGRRAPATPAAALPWWRKEVKALAAQTAKATEEIGVQIAGVQSATQDFVGIIKEICLVGISFHHMKKRSGHLVYASVAQAYSNDIEPFALKGANIEHDQRRDRQPYLNEAQAKNLLDDVLLQYGKKAPA